MKIKRRKYSVSDGILINVGKKNSIKERKCVVTKMYVRVKKPFGIITIKIINLNKNKCYKC